ncbi:anthranilate synthase component I [Demequina sediminicola]|uniref:anthranilate synthase component I n=1 Tax=Demequina sediminicola TaxID=1095026 RepID=UPI0007804822|nr:anthranilate synthase component I [Demequina sediminicola]
MSKLHVPAEWGQTWPPLDTFSELASTHRVVPVVRRVLADSLTPIAVYSALAQERPGTFILESSEPDGTRGRFSFVGVHSRATLSVRGDDASWAGDVPVGLADGAPLSAIREVLKELHTAPIPGMPPLTGGMVGVLGWDIIRQWEPTLPAKAPRDIDVPDAMLLLATDVAAIDHHDGSVWLIANAINANARDTGVESAHAHAVTRLDQMEAALRDAPAGEVSVMGPESGEQDVRQRSAPGEYEAAVRFAKDAIRDGEVFQMVPSQRFEVDCDASPLDVYRVLRTLNPSPYMYYFQLRDDEGRDFAVVGASPESLATVKDQRVTTFPIAGSRPRGATVIEDQRLEEELRADPKEIAEHVMLVDLARNDLVKVCEPTSIEVLDFMTVKRYSHIMHICSTVVGGLEPQYGPVDVLAATFPAGTLSGAPKPRAIALIDEIEPTRRAYYGGAVGYFDFAGNMDMAITIRTALIENGVAHVQAGAGVVADSVPSSEDQETKDKAAAMLRAIGMAARLTPSTRG